MLRAVPSVVQQLSRAGMEMTLVFPALQSFLRLLIPQPALLQAPMQHSRL